MNKCFFLLFLLRVGNLKQCHRSFRSLCCSLCCCGLSVSVAWVEVWVSPALYLGKQMKKYNWHRRSRGLNITTCCSGTVNYQRSQPAHSLSLSPFVISRASTRSIMIKQWCMASKRWPAEIIVFAGATPLPPTAPLLLPTSHHHWGPKRSRLIEQPSCEWPGAWKWCISTGGSHPEVPAFRKQWSKQVAW